MANCTINENPRFTPSLKVISSITKDNPATVTTDSTHGYVSGIIIRFVIPCAVGMQQLDNRTGEITVTGSNTFTVNIDTTKFDDFSVPAIPKWYENVCALVLPIGENSSQVNAAVRDVT